MSWEEDFINKLNNNKYLKLDDTTKKQIFNLINDYSNTNYNLAKNIYNDFARELINTIINNNINLENKKNNLETNLSILEEKYKQLELSSDLELESNLMDTDNILKENNIEFIPLYKCLEFKPNIKENIKNNLESILRDTNILNAKILNNKDIKKALSLNIPIQYLEKTTFKKNNLLKYFEIKLSKDTNIKEERVKEILETISVDQENKNPIFLTENATAQIDTLNIVSNKNYNQIYIGYQKRLEQKQKQLAEISSQIETHRKEISNIKNIIANNSEKISTIEHETANIPDNLSINNIIDKIKEINLSLSWIDTRQQELEKELLNFDNRLKNIKEKINNNKQGLYIPLNLQSYKEVSSKINTINEMLYNLKNNHNTYLNKLEIKLNYQNHLEDIINSIEYTMADENEKKQELNINKQNLNTINELLETEEYKDKAEKLLILEQELINLTHEKETVTKEIASLEKDLEYKQKEQETLVLILKDAEQETKVYKEIFLREYKLNYVYDEEITNLDTTIKNIINNGKEKREFSLTESLTNFYQSYNHYRLELNDYSLRDITLFNDNETEDEKLNNIYHANIRIDISSMYQGIKLNIISLYNRITTDIEESKNLISKQDRHLFEDILLNTVGEKIRNRIESSNDWVNKINSIMATMQENSALSFKLVWKSITATNEEEIDTKELVKILKMDPKLLKPSDAEKLTNHFRSKIKKAEEIYQDSYISFYKIIEEVLDYRSWFTFQLLYQRKGMPQKELTDKTFSKFSGGERAKSMYIPLFASVYAKLNLAKEESLRIIALDEAFAGVDEENIREMFGILKYLDIDFIINSQVLWGDYDTIDDLSICELIRPQNSQVVTVERYRWNGKYKEIINNKKVYNEEV